MEMVSTTSQSGKHGTRLELSMSEVLIMPNMYVDTTLECTYFE